MDDATPPNLIAAVTNEGVAMPHALTRWLDALNAYQSGDPPLLPVPLDELADHVRTTGSLDELPTLALLDEIQRLRFRAAEADVDLAERMRLALEVGRIEARWACLVSAVLGDDAGVDADPQELTRRAILRAQEMRHASAASALAAEKPCDGCGGVKLVWSSCVTCTSRIPADLLGDDRDSGNRATAEAMQQALAGDAKP